MTKRIEKDLIFYHPQKTGSLFCYTAGSEVNFEVVYKAVSRLEKETQKNVACILERRKFARVGLPGKSLSHSSTESDLSAIP